MIGHLNCTLEAQRERVNKLLLLNQNKKDDQFKNVLKTHKFSAKNGDRLNLKTQIYGTKYGPVQSKLDRDSDNGNKFCKFIIF